MEIKISLPQYQGGSTYQHLHGYLKQLELAVHHAQKAVESAEKNGIKITENAFFAFDHLELESSMNMDEAKNAIPKTTISFFDNYYEELQNIELRINLD
mgnify:CR=1 FL=1